MMELLLVCVLQVALLSTGFCFPLCKHYLNRRREGVFHYDRHMRYQLTYTEAQRACLQDFGGKLATRDQLLQAQKSGLEECRAGWITLAEVAYPRINSRWNCGFNKTGLISYGIRQNLNEKWDVFCYKEDDDCSHYDRIYFGLPFGTQALQTSNPSPTTVHNISKSGFTLDPSGHSLNSSTSEHYLPPENFTSFNEIRRSQENMTESRMVKLTNAAQKDKDYQNINYKNVPVSEKDSFIHNASKIISTNRSYTVSTLRPKATTNIIRAKPLELFPNLHDSVSTGINENVQVSQTFGTKQIDALPSQSLPTSAYRPEFISKVFESASTIVSEPTVMSQIEIQANITNVPKTSLTSNLTTKTDLDMTNVSVEFTSQEHTTAENGLQNSPNTPNMQSNMFSETVYEQDFLITANSQSTPLTPLSLGKQGNSKTVDKNFHNFLTSSIQPARNVKQNTDLIGVSSTKKSYMNIEIPTNLYQTADNANQVETAYKQNEAFTIQPSENPVHLSENKRNDSSSRHLTSNLINTTTNEGVAAQVSTEDVQLLATEPSTITYNQSPGTTSDTLISSTIQTYTTTGLIFNPSSQMKGTSNPESKMTVTDRHIGVCGGLLRGISGQFHSPGFPQSYEKDMNCTWVIEAPLGHNIILEFLSLVIEAHRKCEYDYVLVYDGKESDNHVLGRFCGSQHPPQVRSVSNVVTVTMRSDSSVELDGFLLRFSTIQSTTGIYLVGGKNSMEGIVEVDYQGFRGNICPKHWSNKDAQVVCRQLGFYGPAIATRIIGEDTVSWAISYVNCSGNEAVLENCNLENSGVCDTTEKAGVICQVYESCAALKNVGVKESGVYIIDPDGVDQGEKHFYVECDMKSDSLTGITIVGHDAESKERVIPCGEPGCYSRTITYKAASLAQLKMLTSLSESCEQFVKLDCRHIRFLDGPWGWWVSRDGDPVNSWGGAPTDSGRCACGENGNCDFEMTSCNCDANDDVWRTDEGEITDKLSLPIKELRFGGTDITRSMAFYRIGKLRCWGVVSEPPILESCAALKEAGITESGKYVIDPDGVDKGLPEFEVFCDMSSQSGITVIGHNSERRIPVSPCEDPGCYKREVTYSADLAQLNALTKVSQSCEQFVRLDCRHVRFIQNGWGWWDSWDGKKMNYWGGADSTIGGCACGKTGTCAFPDKLCNCDSNDNVWRTDDGFLRDKTALPIKAVHFGDTNNFPLEMAYHSIGKLRCKGRA
ncbi:uncharacterized protein [Pyxicephalus adspersus]|uniref:uncharacterized protein n=1 Tax=Pyxicephalus adspersus TaxID=30357 RepID=UPI003B5AD1EE